MNDLEGELSHLLMMMANSGLAQKKESDEEAGKLGDQQRTELQSRISELTDKLQSQTEDNANLQLQIRALSQTLESSQSRVMHLEETVTQSDDVAKGLRVEVDNLTEALHTAHKHAHEMLTQSRDKDPSFKELKRAESATEELRAEIIQLKEEVVGASLCCSSGFHLD